MLIVRLFSGWSRRARTETGTFIGGVALLIEDDDGDVVLCSQPTHRRTASPTQASSGAALDQNNDDMLLCTQQITSAQCSNSDVIAVFGFFNANNDLPLCTQPQRKDATWGSQRDPEG